MWKVTLKPEARKAFKNPDRFASGLNNVYNGLTIAMCGVGFMLVLYFNKPEDVLKPTWIILLGLGMAAWGEWKKMRSK